jgi:citrate synthase
VKKGKALQSRMGWSTVDTITVQGFDFANELLGKIDLGTMAFLEIQGDALTKEARVFNALLVTLVEHGMTPQAMTSRLVYLASPEAL